MILLDYLAITALWVSIIIYAALGGADFGAGIWDFFAFGPHAKEERSLITRAVGPVWEANNVWLIYLVVGLFTAFPVVSATLSTALFIPFSLVLLGIVLRGASFGFRTHFNRAVAIREIWGRAFGLASIITPFLLGAMAAAVASGHIRVHQGRPPVALFGVWLTPFAIVVGCMALALCATLAAVYLTVQARRFEMEPLANRFRIRALIAGGVTAVLGLVGFILMPFEAPLLWSGMFSRTYAIWAVGVTILIGAATAGALYFKRYKLARILADLDTAALLGAWGLAQVPYIIPPDLTVTNAASPPTTLWEFLVSVTMGMLILVPSLWFLFHIFEFQSPVPPVHEKEVKGV
ncbi:MAG: cytochrome d ubiquinol oxidase subunit II [Ktedonobacteraceae bacterium]